MLLVIKSSAIYTTKMVRLWRANNCS